MIDTKKAYLEKMQGKLQEWKADIDKLKAKATQAKADVKIELSKEIDAAESQHRELERQRQELDRADESTWEQVKGGVQNAWDKLDGTFKSITDRFK